MTTVVEPGRWQRLKTRITKFARETLSTLYLLTFVITVMAVGWLAWIPR